MDDLIYLCLDCGLKFGATGSPTDLHPCPNCSIATGEDPSEPL